MKPRIWNALAFGLAALIAIGLSTIEARGAAISPAEALKRMRVAEGFEVKLIASEPNIRQPVTMSFDERGRIWVVQYLQYPNPAGLTAVSVDQYLRTKYDRVPEPPPRGPKGADKVTICEDTNGDGVPDKFVDFITELNLASGMALGYGGVFVAQPPYLLFYADKNRDDVPDGDPEVLLSGFGMEDSHAFANSLTWGPDGWLYGAHGSTVTANIRGIEFQQGIWRYHPVTREFELFAEGGGNTWGVDFNEDGELIAGTNFGEQIGLHQVQGAYYLKGFAKHGPLHNPHTYGYFDHIPFKGFKGGHVTCGGIVYQGGAFPEQFNGTYIAANLLSSAIYWHALERNGSSIKGQFGGPLLETDDNTFRPIDCITGPDGALYIVDWCDPRATHVDSVDNWDKTSGRIYRIASRSSRGNEALSKAAMRNAKPETSQSLLTSAATNARFDLAKLTSSELVDQLTNRNDWFRCQARQLLAERRDTNVIPRLRAQLLQTTNPDSSGLALQSLWALYGSGGFDDAIAAKLLKHSHPPVRSWTVRLLGDTKNVSRDMARDLQQLAIAETDARVRSQLAASAQRWSHSVLPIILKLCGHDEDVRDPFIPLQIWWALERHALSDADRIITMFSLLEGPEWKRPLIQQHILERLARRYAADGIKGTKLPHANDGEDASGLAPLQTGFDACASLLEFAPGPDEERIVLRGIDKALEGQRVAVAGRLSNLVARLSEERLAEPLLLRVSLRFGIPAARKLALEKLVNSQNPESERGSLAQILGETGGDAAVPALVRLLDESPGLQTAAISALQNFSDSQVPTELLRHYRSFRADLRTRTRTVLASRPSWAVQLVHAVESGNIDAKEISPDMLRQMIRHNDALLTAAIEKRWGRLQPQSSAEKTSAVNRLKLVLNPSGTTLRFQGDPVEGKKLFTQTCAVCHKLFREGNTIGPELTGADRKNTEWLLTHTVDPSAFIRPEYVNHNVEMKDERSLTGLIVEQSDSALTLLDAQNQRTVLNRADVKEIIASSTSLMPEGLLEALTPQQVRDLFSYLQSNP